MKHSVTETFEVFSLDELDERAQERAYQEWYEGQASDYAWNRENEASLKAFCDEFDVKTRDWSYGGGGRDYIVWEWRGDQAPCWDNTPCSEYPGTPEGDEWNDGLSGQRLATWLWNHKRHFLFKGKYYSKSKTVDGKYTYVHRRSKVFLEEAMPTGYCMDYPLIHPFIEFMGKPDSRNLYDLVDEALDGWLKDCASDYEHSISEEYFKEEAAERGLLFEKNGDVWGDQDDLKTGA